MALCMAAPASAQNTTCDPSQFATVTNMWKVEPDQNTADVPAGELAAERKVMRRVVEMFRSAFVPTGAAGYQEVNYLLLPHAALNRHRYGNTYTYTLSNHKIECYRDKPAVLDVSLGVVSVQVNVQFVGEAEIGDSAAGFSYLPRGYYQRKEGIALPQAAAEGTQEFNFVDSTTVWWLTRGGALPFRYVTQREFVKKQVEIQRARSAPSAALLAYYERLLGEATDDIAFVKEGEGPGSGERRYVFTTLEDRGNRVYVTVNPDYYDRQQPKSAPQHILIRLKVDVPFLNRQPNGARHLESMQKLREIVRANLPEFRSMVK
jgi:hypothetical protein